MRISLVYTVYNYNTITLTIIGSFVRHYAQACREELFKVEGRRFELLK